MGGCGRNENYKNHSSLVLFMSERQYFSLRYAVPGFTFILFALAINYVPIFMLAQNGAHDVFLAFLGFVSLFSGSAIGFLISQFHWRRYKWRGGFFRIFRLGSVANFLIEKYEMKKELKCRHKDMESVLDFTLQLEKNEKLHRYVSRRWDMYHVLSGANWSLFLGVAVGVCTRIYYEGSLFLFSCSSIPGLAETFTQFFILGSAFVLFLIIEKSKRELIEDYRPFLKAALIYAIPEDGQKKHDFYEKLKWCFPDYFP